MQEIETWVEAMSYYDNNEFEAALVVFDRIADTSKILFNCGVINATLGEHLKAVCGYCPRSVLVEPKINVYRWNTTKER